MVSSRDRTVKSGGGGGGGSRNGEFTGPGDQVSVWGDEKVLEWDGDCRAVGTYLSQLSCILKMGSLVNFILS